jgi:membrane associated rhomboid family serine protease
MMMTPWVLRLIIANTAISLIAMSWPDLFRLFMFVPALTPVRPWTIVTYMFIHGGLAHLFFNMLGLLFFGPRLEAKLGGRHFLSLYLASGVMGALLCFFNPLTPIVGASGATFGVFLAFAFYWPRERIIIFPIPFPIEARVLVGIMTFISLFQGIRGGGGIAHLAHLGGFAGGYLYLRWMEWSSPTARFKRKTAAPAARVEDRERWLNIRREDLHPVNRQELDRVLAKIDAGGIGSLNNEERAFLNRFAPV